MLNSGGNRETPVCDDSFGGGKTSFIFKFRKVLDVMLKEKRWIAPKKYQFLKKAVYIHVPFTTYGYRGSSPQDCVNTVLVALRYALITSSQSKDIAALSTLFLFISYFFLPFISFSFLFIFFTIIVVSFQLYFFPS
jgi:hypothetical protein